MPKQHPVGRDRLQQYLETERATLLRSIRYYVLRAGLASGEGVAQVADDLFHDMVVEAFHVADRLAADIQARPWLLGIAANLIKRRQSETAKRERREPLVRDLYPEAEQQLSDEELFDLLPNAAGGFFADFGDREQVKSLLLGVSKSDREVLQLAILHDLDGYALAQALGVNPSAARVRLHRALNRLRQAWVERAENGGNE